jgi:hypothetical protein
MGLSKQQGPLPRAPYSTMDVSDDSDVELFDLDPSARSPSEAEFWKGPEEASPESLPLSSVVPRRHRPSWIRWVVVKLLTLIIVGGLLLLIATELSIVLHRPWLDPRPFLLKLLGR